MNQDWLDFEDVLVNAAAISSVEYYGSSSILHMTNGDRISVAWTRDELIEKLKESAHAA